MWTGRKESKFGGSVEVNRLIVHCLGFMDLYEAFYPLFAANFFLSGQLMVIFVMA